MLFRLKSILATGVAAAIFAFSATTSGAATFTLDATSRGCLEADGSSGCGFGFTPTGNFFTGETSNSDRLRSFFLFDLSGVSGTVTGVSLTLDSGNIFKDIAPESVGFFQMAQSSFDTLESGSGSASIYSDLGTGVNLGGPTLDSDIGVFSFAGGASWINAVAGAIGGDFGFGGSVLTYDSALREGVFGGSAGDTFQLVITTKDPSVVPLPAGLPLLLAGLGGLALVRRRR